MHKNSKAFTIIELLVVITIIGILTTISVFSFKRIQANARDTQRSSKTTVIVEALEGYYSKYGEYPSCNAMSQAADTIADNTLIGINSDVLTTPSDDSGTNSILPACADLTGSVDAFAYVGDISTTCLTGTGQTSACTQFTLKYREEITGNIISITSRHSMSIENEIASPTAPTAPTTTVTLSGSNVLATITPVTCSSSTAQYQINSRTNDGIWAGYTDWSTTTTTTQTAADGVKYGYQAQARCYVNSTLYSAASTGLEGTYIDPIATPSTPVIATPATSNSTTTTWSWGAISCPGNTVRYQYDYLINAVSQAPSGWKTPSVPTATSISFTTSSQGYTYAIITKAQCYSTFATSAWSATSNSVSYFRPIANYTLTTAAGSGGTVSGGGSYSPGATPTITATADSGYSFSSWSGSTGCSGSSSHTITMDSNKSCTASFTQDTSGWIAGFGDMNGKYVRSTDSGSPSIYTFNESSCPSGGRVPTLYELESIYRDRSYYGSFQGYYYWSSSEYDSWNGYTVYFWSGAESWADKGIGYYVRCVADSI